jgi:hypothetical protein
MPSESQKDMDELLSESERHTCPTLQDHWTMITVKDGNGTIWNNAFGNPEGPAESLTPMIFDLRFCPFCGERFGEPDEITKAVIEVLEGALACVDNVGYMNYSKADFEQAMRVKGELYGDQIQITVLDPHLKMT